MYKDFINEDLDADPLYNEIEHEISQLYDSIDPLLPIDNDQHSRINWHDLLNNTEELLSKGKDIRVLIWKMRAILHIDGISSLYDTLKILENIIIKDDEQKSSLTDGDKQVLSEFAASLGWFSNVQCINEIKNSFIAPAVRVTVRTMLDIDILKSNNSLTYPELITSIEKANLYFKDEKRIPGLKEQLTINVELLKSLEDFVNEYSDGYILDCKSLIQLIQRFLNKLKSFDELSLKEDDEISLEDTQNSKSNNFKANNDKKTKSLSEIKYANTRSEAVLLLDNVLQYFQIYEPSHPAPILIKRAQKMIGMDFESIIQELLPESIEALKLYTGRIKEESNIDN